MAPATTSAAAGGGEPASGRRKSWSIAAVLVALAGLGIALGVVYGRGGAKNGGVADPAGVEVQSLNPSIENAKVGLDAVLADLSKGQGNEPEAPFTDLGNGAAISNGGGSSSASLPSITVDEGLYGLSANAPAATGDKLLGKAAALSIAKSTFADGACRVANAEELRAAVEQNACPVVILTNSARDAYVLKDEIVVRRSVVVMGNSVVLPYIDCSQAVRGFRVTAGAYLEMQFVRANVGAGEARNRIGIFRDRKTQEATTTDNGEETGEYEDVWREMTQEDLAALSPEERKTRKLQLGGQEAEADPLQVIEIRGGTVLFEPGAIGGSFNGVYFTSDQTDAGDVMTAIEQTLSLIGFRIWGGHVLMAGGTVTFNGCIFYDLELLTPLTDRIYFGGDVLVLAGTAYFTGCAWFYTTVIGAENGLGFNVAMFAGASIFTACHFQEQNAAAAYNGVGQAFFVGGGVQIVTGCNFVYFSALQFFSGTGELTVLAGVQVITGVSWEEYYGCFAYYGAGLDYAVMAGVMVMTGATLNQWSGPIWGSIAGDYVFVGAGSLTAHGTPIAQYASIGGETGSGLLAYVAAGTAVFIGAPVFDVVGVWSVFAIGEYYGVSAGFLVMIGCPMIEIAGIEYFKGLGGYCYLGTGGVVIGYAPAVEMIALKNEHFDFYFAGSCEPEHGAWAPGKPFYVMGGMGCEHEEHEEHEARELTSQTPNRRHQRLLQSAALSMGGLSLLWPEKDMILAANITKTRLKIDDAAQAQLLSSIGAPGQMMEAAHGVESLRSALGLTTTDSDPATVYIHGMRDGYCGLCGVDSVSGPGAASCDVADSCDNLVTPFASADGGQETAAALVDYAALDYREHFVVTADLDTLAPTLLTVEDVQAAVTEGLMAGEEDGADDLLDALQVTVHDGQADPMLKANFPEFYPDIHDRALSDFHRRMAADPTDVAQRFKVSVVTTTRAAQDSVLAAMRHQSAAEEADGSSSLDAAVKDYFLLEKDLELGATRLAVEKTLYVPAYNSKALLANDASKPTSAFTVALVDPEQPALPVTQAHYGTPYAIKLDNFPPNSQVNLQLVRKQAGPNTLLTDPSWPINTALAVDAEGSALTTYTFQQLLARQQPGDYYLKATDVKTGIYNLSPLFELSSEKRRRKLYGPIMWA